jgi:hypothetical protein
VRANTPCNLRAITVHPTGYKSATSAPWAYDPDFLLDSNNTQYRYCNVKHDPGSSRLPFLTIPFPHSSDWDDASCDILHFLSPLSGWFGRGIRAALWINEPCCYQVLNQAKADDQTQQNSTIKASPLN